MKIGLLSHYFTDTNLGCVALSICNIRMIDKAAKEQNIDISYVILVNEKQKQIEIDVTDNPYEYRVYSSTLKSIRHPIKWLKLECFYDCDLVFNLCAGDGFSDIYGLNRVISETYMTNLAHIKKCPVVLAPQTIGPYSKRISKVIAKYTMSKCEKIYTRDEQSTNCCKILGLTNKVSEVIDVAFALPYRTIKFESNKLKIGINVSGLLYKGGYDGKNYFNLALDYKEFVISSISHLLKNDEYQIHLIAHVIGEDDFFEDDYEVCKELQKMFPKTILAPRYISPIEVKGYIAGMDLFLGARMHSTIAAFSSSVPVIPISYSRKFNGLFNSLKYPYVIDARAESSIDEAIKQIDLYISKIDELKKKEKESKAIYELLLYKYQKEVEALLEKYR